MKTIEQLTIKLEIEPYQSLAFAREGPTCYLGNKSPFDIVWGLSISWIQAIESVFMVIIEVDNYHEYYSNFYIANSHEAYPAPFSKLPRLSFESKIRATVNANTKPIPH